MTSVALPLLSTDVILLFSLFHFDTQLELNFMTLFYIPFPFQSVAAARLAPPSSFPFIAPGIFLLLVFLGPFEAVEIPPPLFYPCVPL